MLKKLRQVCRVSNLAVLSLHPSVMVSEPRHVNSIQYNRVISFRSQTVKYHGLTAVRSVVKTSTNQNGDK